MESVERAANAFDCNICLDSAREPIVTHCGHLYCWPCIFMWLQIQSASLRPNKHPQCPVCKADISHASMVPLYGCGQSPSTSENKGNLPHQSMVVPPRLVVCRGGITTPYQNHIYDMNTRSHLEEAFASTFFDLDGTPFTGYNHLYVGTHGEMVYNRVFGNSESLFVHPNSYYHVASSSRRLRRQAMKANKLLSRITIFLFCFFILCLLAF